MDIFLPDLERSFELLHFNFKAFSFIIMCWALMKQINKAEGMPEMIKPMVRAMTITMLIAYSHHLYSLAEHGILDIANFIDPQYKHNPIHSIADANEFASGEKKGLIRSLFSDGGYQSLSLSLSHMAIKLFSLIQIPMLIIQYFLTKLGYLGMPILMTFFMFGSLGSLAMKYFVQILTIMAWPIGFAITNVVTSNILGSFNTEDSGASILGLTSGTHAGEMGAGVLAGLMSLVGTLTTPIVMNQIFSSGAGLMSAMGAAAGITKAASGVVIGGGKIAAGVAAKGGSMGYNGVKSGYNHFTGGSGASSSGVGSKPSGGGDWSKKADDMVRNVVKAKPTVSDV